MDVKKGFSKLTHQQKVDHVIAATGLSESVRHELERFRHPSLQAMFDEFSENTLSNFYIPFGIAPNFMINGQMYVVPMVIEESSVVAAASRAAAFWAMNGGFKTHVHDTVKTGQLWFQWKGDFNLLLRKKIELLEWLKASIREFTHSMEQRGGGIKGIDLIPLDGIESTLQLQVNFDTAESMGANFINSCLEQLKLPLVNFFVDQQWPEPEIIMAILSNHAPNCLVTCRAECDINQLADYSDGIDPNDFARKYKLAVNIACKNVDRAVTHNKGIFNGIDAVVIATGNDFRAVEAGGHAYASRTGQYQALSDCNITDLGKFQIKLTIPMVIGTVGGLTKLHPLAALAMEILKRPSVKELMGIIAAVGMASNFAAISALVTSGIQKGHMKLHITNILNSMNATSLEKSLVQQYFNDKTTSYKEVRDYIMLLRGDNIV